MMEVAPKEKAVEDEPPLGGMRNPHHSAHRIHRSLSIGQAVRQLLDKAQIPMA